MGKAIVVLLPVSDFNNNCDYKINMQDIMSIKRILLT